MVVAHAHSLVSMEHALAAGFDGIEHFTGLTSGGPPPNVPTSMVGGAVTAKSRARLALVERAHGATPRAE